MPVHNLEDGGLNLRMGLTVNVIYLSVRFNPPDHREFPDGP